MRVVICLTHNMLMEPRHPDARYLHCEACTEVNKKRQWRDRLVDWFPVAFANRNHLDGEMRRTWAWNPYSYKGPRWERLLDSEQMEFYMKRRLAAEAVKKNAETGFVCRPCMIAADAGLHGEKNHTDAGCKGEQACDCQHREPRS